MTVGLLYGADAETLIFGDRGPRKSLSPSRKTKTSNISGISKPMVWQTYGLRAGRQNDENDENDENNEDNSDRDPPTEKISKTLNSSKMP